MNQKKKRVRCRVVLANGDSIICDGCGEHKRQLFLYESNMLCLECRDTERSIRAIMIKSNLTREEVLVKFSSELDGIGGTPLYQEGESGSPEGVEGGICELCGDKGVELHDCHGFMACGVCLGDDMVPDNEEGEKPEDNEGDIRALMMAGKMSREEARDLLRDTGEKVEEEKEENIIYKLCGSCQEPVKVVFRGQDGVDRCEKCLGGIGVSYMGLGEGVCEECGESKFTLVKGYGGKYRCLDCRGALVKSGTTTTTPTTSTVVTKGNKECYNCKDMFYGVYQMNIGGTNRDVCWKCKDELSKVPPKKLEEGIKIELEGHPDGHVMEDGGIWRKAGGYGGVVVVPYNKEDWVLAVTGNRVGTVRKAVMEEEPDFEKWGIPREYLELWAPRLVEYQTEALVIYGKHKTRPNDWIAVMPKQENTASSVDIEDVEKSVALLSQKGYRRVGTIHTHPGNMTTCSTTDTGQIWDDFGGIHLIVAKSGGIGVYYSGGGHTWPLKSEGWEYEKLWDGIDRGPIAKRKPASMFTEEDNKKYDEFIDRRVYSGVGGWGHSNNRFFEIGNQDRGNYQRTSVTTTHTPHSSRWSDMDDVIRWYSHKMKHPNKSNTGECSRGLTLLIRVLGLAEELIDVRERIEFMAAGVKGEEQQVLDRASDLIGGIGGDVLYRISGNVKDKTKYFIGIEGKLLENVLTEAR